ncbi:MAG: type III pantothenate kinase [Glaciecola sp.]|jgi:type III pantothenate kinase
MALERRPGDHRRSATVASGATDVLLAVDVGNSNTVLGIFRGEELVEHWRISTDQHATVDELALQFHGLLAFADLSFSGNVRGVIISSVVPKVTESLREMVTHYFPFPPVVVEPGIRTGIALRYDNPKEIGADRLVNAVAAYTLYGAPSIVVDFGTSTNFDVVGENGEFLGGVISPGVMTSMEALVVRAARLPKIEVHVPASVVGRSTVSAMQSGIIYGTAGQVDTIVERIIEEVGMPMTVVATGGLAPAILQACRTIDHHDPWLTLKGLRIIWDRNVA